MTIARSEDINKDYTSILNYTNGKKKQCIVKMLIAHKICSG